MTKEEICTPPMLPPRAWRAAAARMAFPQAPPNSGHRTCKIQQLLNQILLSVYCVLRIVSLSENMALSKRSLPTPHTGCLMCIVVGVLVCSLI